MKKLLIIPLLFVFAATNAQVYQNVSPNGKINISHGTVFEYPMGIVTGSTTDTVKMLSKNADSLKKLPVDTLNGRNGYLLSFDSVNHKWVIVPPASGGGGGSYTFSTGITNSSGTVTNNLSTGIAGGQELVGGTAAGDTLLITSTTNNSGAITTPVIQIGVGTNGQTKLMSFTGNGHIGVGTTTPDVLTRMDMSSMGTANPNFTLKLSGNALSPYALLGFVPSSGTISGIIEKGSTGYLFFGETADAGGYIFRGAGASSFEGALNVAGVIGGGGLTISKANTSGYTIGMIQNLASNATTNFARLTLAPHGGFSNTNAPYIQAYNSSNNAGLSWGVFNGTLGTFEAMRLSIDGNLLVASTTDNANGKVQITGNLALETAGNKINIATGTNASVGTSTLSSGTVTVSTTAVTSSSKIFLTHAGSSITNAGVLYVGTITNGTSFVITSNNASDNDTVNWWIIN